MKIFQSLNGVIGAAAVLALLAAPTFAQHEGPGGHEMHDGGNPRGQPSNGGGGQESQASSRGGLGSALVFAAGDVQPDLRSILAAITANGPDPGVRPGGDRSSFPVYGAHGERPDPGVRPDSQGNGLIGGLAGRIVAGPDGARIAGRASSINIGRQGGSDRAGGEKASGGGGGKAGGDHSAGDRTKR